MSAPIFTGRCDLVLVYRSDLKRHFLMFKKDKSCWRCASDEELRVKRVDYHHLCDTCLLREQESREYEDPYYGGCSCCG